MNFYDMLVFDDHLSDPKINPDAAAGTQEMSAKLLRHVNDPVVYPFKVFSRFFFFSCIHSPDLIRSNSNIHNILHKLAVSLK